MAHIKLTGNEKLNLTNEEAEKLQQVILDEYAPKFVQVQGQTIKTANIVGVFTDKQQQPAFMEFSWADEQLEQFETEIFERFTTFNEYLISEGIIDTEDRVKNPDTYRMLNAKWSKLNELRFRREEKSGFKGREKQLKEMKESFKEAVKPIEPEPYKIDEIVPRDEIIVEKIPF